MPHRLREGEKIGAAVLLAARSQVAHALAHRRQRHLALAAQQDARDVAAQALEFGDRGAALLGLRRRDFPQRHRRGGDAHGGVEEDGELRQHRAALPADGAGAHLAERLARPLHRIARGAVARGEALLAPPSRDDGRPRYRCLRRGNQLGHRLPGAGNLLLEAPVGAQLPEGERDQDGPQRAAAEAQRPELVGAAGRADGKADQERDRRVDAEAGAAGPDRAHQPRGDGDGEHEERGQPPMSRRHGAQQQQAGADHGEQRHRGEPVAVGAADIDHRSVERAQHCRIGEIAPSQRRQHRQRRHRGDGAAQRRRQRDAIGPGRQSRAELPELPPHGRHHSGGVAPGQGGVRQVLYISPGVEAPWVLATRHGERSEAISVKHRLDAGGRLPRRPAGASQ